MFESFEDYKDKGIVMAVGLSVIAIAVSGIFFAILYFALDSTNTALQASDCVIENNTLVSSCQDLFQLSIYPFLALKDVLVWVSFLFIFALVLGVLVLGYRSGQSPVLMGYLVAIIIAMTYISIHIANIYRDLLSNPVFLSMMTGFVAYNRIMLNFPWFVFIITLMATLLGVVNYQKTKVNKFSDREDLNY